ncbi:hypothetical protein WICMUC_003883 [Wickerhamomyces mucosus]|uniref:Negative regulator of sporulation MDS3 n=1 Tax=Wickerhamomyces mucosus TaxID=1378264 RepID=A0A9P8PJB0_9ASCO|nr:hypothetical protein WICMUC_003883 [Wickerhamomyces mucosus]
MAPLLPSESNVYTLALPEELQDDDRFSLKIRTGAAVTYTKSNVAVHGGLTVGLNLERILTSEIEQQLNDLNQKDWSKLISNELFYLNIITRTWSRIDLEGDQLKPKPRLFHSITFYDQSLYLFGGLVLDETTSSFIPANDLWEFNIESKEWICIDDGSQSGMVARYDHTIISVDYVSPKDNKLHPSLTITGGKGELNQELNHIVLYDLESSSYINNTEMRLTLNELQSIRTNSNSSAIDPKSSLQSKTNREKLKCSSESNFVISGVSNVDLESNDDALVIFSQKPSKEFDNPLISLPVVPGAAGLRLPLAFANRSNRNVVPQNLIHPSGGVFGPNIIVSGYSKTNKEYEAYLFNRPSQKWTRLNLNTNRKAKDLYLWKSFSWQSHHKVLILGSGTPIENSSFNTIQTFDLLVSVGLPVTNVFHAFEVDENRDARTSSAGQKKFSSVKENTSFEAYSKYIAPSTKISSIRNVFPSHAVTLGRNAFERYGHSLADFEFITADGQKVNVPLMLLRKRWGRCFDMLLAKAYSRAVYQLENQKGGENNEDDAHSELSLSGGKRSVTLMNKAAQSSQSHISKDESAPQFRLPFQEQSSPLLTSFTPPQSSSGPTSRKASVISAGNLSMTTTSTSEMQEPSLSLALDFDSLPPQLPPPNEPLPSLEPVPPSEKFAPLKSAASSSYLRDSPRESPRGSILGSLTPSTHTGLNQLNTALNSKLKGYRPSTNGSKKRGPPRSSSVPPNDDTSVNDLNSNIDSLTPESFIDEEGRLVLEPLLIPRSLYLPFSTATVEAVSEFLFTGRLGDKWLLTPTTTDTFLISKFYELPLLYDLIAEVLYAVIGKKESALIKDYGILLKTYHHKLKEIFKDDESQIDHFFENHPHVHKAFFEIENYLNTVDDGYLNVSLLKRASKVSNFSTESSSASDKAGYDNERKSSLGKDNGRIGKSSLSKEVKVNNDDNEDGDSDAESYHPESTIAESKKEIADSSKKEIKHNNAPTQASVFRQSNDDDGGFFKKTSYSKEINYDLDIGPKEVNSVTKHDSLDEDDPLSVSVHSGSALDDTSGEHEILSVGDVDSDKTRTKSEGEQTFQVPEGRFKLSKEKRSRPLLDDSDSDKEDSKDSTSDSDNMGVGLGLVQNLKLNPDAKPADDLSKPSGKNIDITNELEDEYKNLATLENLASPDSPPPGDHLLLLIYETAALACDMKLLLRSANALEISKTLNSKKLELLSELQEFSLKREEDQLKEKLLEREKGERLKKHHESGTKENFQDIKSKSRKASLTDSFERISKDEGLVENPKLRTKKSSIFTKSPYPDQPLPVSDSTSQEKFTDDLPPKPSMKTKKSFSPFRSFSSLSLFGFSSQSNVNLPEASDTNELQQIPPQFYESTAETESQRARISNKIKRNKLLSLLSRKSSKK